MAITDEDIKEYLEYSIFYVAQMNQYFLVKDHDNGETVLLEATNMEDAEQEALKIMKDYVEK